MFCPVNLLQSNHYGTIVITIIISCLNYGFTGDAILFVHNF